MEKVEFVKRAVKTVDAALCIGVMPENGALRPVGALPTQKEEECHLPDVDRRLPIIEFAIADACTLSIAQTFQVPATMCPASGTNGVAGSGAWTVHASSVAVATNHESAAKNVHNALMQEIKQQIHAYGYFYQPFMVRYAVRLTDGEYAAVSSPVLLMPSMQPPCITLASSAISGDIATLALNGNACIGSMLKYRVLEALPAELEAFVAGIDVFCTEQMLTYYPDQAGTEGIITENNTQCWQFVKDPTWIERMLENGKFYRMATLQVSDINVSSQFIKLKMGDNSAECIKKRPCLPDGLANQSSMRPCAISKYGQNVLLAGGQKKVPKPMPLRSMMAYSTNLMDDVQVKVLAKTDGNAYATALQCRGSLHNARYLYTDIPGAFAILVSAEGNDYYFRLTQHSSLPGAYWWGGAEASPELVVAASDQEIPNEMTWLDCPAELRIATVLIPWHATRIFTLGCSQIIAVKHALTSMSAGQFGQYLAYIFSDDGLWVLPNDKTQPVLISHDVCDNPLAIAEGEGNVTFLATRGMMMAQGAKVERVNPIDLDKLDFQLDDLMQLVRVGRVAGLSLPTDDWESVVNGGKLIYDRKAQRYVVSNDNSDTVYVYSKESDTWCVCDKLSLRSAMVLSNPIANDPAKPVTKASAIGRFDSSAAAIAVYGSDDLLQWEAIASAADSKTDILVGHHYKYVIIAFAAALDAGDYIKSVALT